MSTLDMRLCASAPGRFANDPGVFGHLQLYASGSSDSQLEPCLDRLGIGKLDWRLPRQNAVRLDLDHEVRVDLMLGIALAVPGHHIPLILSL